ncbi:hypothetical protein B0H21DRAFT_254532 [Amylocystis lapponica]|nr:hypothetical protein B0H21DRAFT_254532 [Amylocystis lapponica]
MIPQGTSIVPVLILFPWVLGFVAVACSSICLAPVTEVYRIYQPDVCTACTDVNQPDVPHYFSSLNCCGTQGFTSTGISQCRIFALGRPFEFVQYQLIPITSVLFARNCYQCPDVHHQRCDRIRAQSPTAWEPPDMMVLTVHLCTHLILRPWA